MTYQTSLTETGLDPSLTSATSSDMILQSSFPNLLSSPSLTMDANPPPDKIFKYAINLSGLLGPHVCETLVHFLLPHATIHTFRYIPRAAPTEPIASPRISFQSPRPEPVRTQDGQQYPSLPVSLPRAPLHCLLALRRLAERRFQVVFRREDSLSSVRAASASAAQALAAVTGAFVGADDDEAGVVRLSAMDYLNGLPQCLHGLDAVDISSFFRYSNMTDAGVFVEPSSPVAVPNNNTPSALASVPEDAAPSTTQGSTPAHTNALSCSVCGAHALPALPPASLPHSRLPSLLASLDFAGNKLCANSLPWLATLLAGSTALHVDLSSCGVTAAFATALFGALSVSRVHSLRIVEGAAVSGPTLVPEGPAGFSAPGSGTRISCCGHAPEEEELTEDPGASSKGRINQLGDVGLGAVAAFIAARYSFTMSLLRFLLWRAANEEQRKEDEWLRLREERAREVRARKRGKAHAAHAAEMEEVSTDGLTDAEESGVDVHAAARDEGEELRVTEGRVSARSILAAAPLQAVVSFQRATDRLDLQDAVPGQCRCGGMCTPPPAPAPAAVAADVSTSDISSFADLSTDSHNALIAARGAGPCPCTYGAGTAAWRCAESTLLQYYRGLEERERPRVLSQLSVCGVGPSAAVLAAAQTLRPLLRYGLVRLNLAHNGLDDTALQLVCGAIADECALASTCDQANDDIRRSMQLRFAKGLRPGIPMASQARIEEEIAEKDALTAVTSTKTDSGATAADGGAPAPRVVTLRPQPVLSLAFLTLSYNAFSEDPRAAWYLAHAVFTQRKLRLLDVSHTQLDYSWLGLLAQGYVHGAHVLASVFGSLDEAWRMVQRGALGEREYRDLARGLCGEAVAARERKRASEEKQKKSRSRSEHLRGRERRAEKEPSSSPAATGVLSPLVPDTTQRSVSPTKDAKNSPVTDEEPSSEEDAADSRVRALLGVAQGDLADFAPLEERLARERVTADAEAAAERAREERLGALRKRVVGRERSRGSAAAESWRAEPMSPSEPAPAPALSPSRAARPASPALEEVPLARVVSALEEQLLGNPDADGPLPRSRAGTRPNSAIPPALAGAAPAVPDAVADADGVEDDEASFALLQSLTDAASALGSSSSVSLLGAARPESAGVPVVTVRHAPPSVGSLVMNHTKATERYGHVFPCLTHHMLHDVICYSCIPCYLILFLNSPLPQYLRRRRAALHRARQRLLRAAPRPLPHRHPRPARAAAHARRLAAHALPRAPGRAAAHCRRRALRAGLAPRAHGAVLRAHLVQRPRAAPADAAALLEDAEPCRQQPRGT